MQNIESALQAGKENFSNLKMRLFKMKQKNLKTPLYSPEKYFLSTKLSSMSNPLDSRKTKLLKTKTAEFSINNKQF